MSTPAASGDQPAPSPASPTHDPDAGAGPGAASGSGLRRGLSARHLQLIAIGGAIGTGLFLGSGKVISLTGPSIIFVYMIIGFVLFFLMRGLGELLLSNLEYKTFGDIAKDMMGPWAGFFVSWTYWFSWVIAVVADIVAITAYVRFMAPEIPLWVPALLTALGLLVLNLQPVKWFGETEFWFAIVKIVAILALIAVGLWMILTGFENTEGDRASLTYLWDRGGMFPLGLSGFVLGFQLGIFSFIGIELVGTTAAETARPHVNLPKAINSIVLRILIFYVGAMVVIMAVTPWDRINPEASPFTSMFGMAGLTAAAFVVNLVVLTSAASSANSGIYSGTRMLFGLAHDGQASASFGRVNRRFVPQNAVFFTCAFLIAAVPVLYGGDSVLEAFTFVSSVCSSLVLFTWSMITISYIRYRRKYPERHAAARFRMPLPRVMPWVILGFFVFIAWALFQGEDTRPSLLATPAWFIALFLVWRGFRGRRRAAIGANAEEPGVGAAEPDPGGAGR